MAFPPTLDFDTLDRDSRQASALTRRALAWLVALLLLVAASAALMVVFLRQEEAREADRRRTADAEWLDQTLRFHFRRLENDLAARAVQVDAADAPATASVGPWAQTPGLMVFEGWVPAGRGTAHEHWPEPMREAARDPASAAALATLLDTTRGLQRAAYAGPLPAASPQRGPLLWLAVPRFEQGRFLGDQVVAVAADGLLRELIPAWFLDDHRLTLASDGQDTPAATDAPAHVLVPVHLPGAQFRVRVDALADTAPVAPRAFFGVAMACLAGMLLALFRLWRDTARRQRAEVRLQTQLALRTAMERSVTLGLRAWDTNGRLLYANPAFARLVGWSTQALTTAPPGPPPYWPPEQGDEFERLRRSASDPEQQQAGQALQLLHRDGHRLEVLAHSAPLMLADGTVAGWVGSVLDITERRRVERLVARQQELLEASARLAAVGEVASTLAHELNQPLGALSGFATGLLNRLRERRIEPDDVAPVVERIEALANKAGRVIQRVNALARRQEVLRQPLALAPFIARVAAHAGLPEDVLLDIDLPPDEGPTVPADALLLENALHNLLQNAAQWAPRSGRRPARVQVGVVTSASPHEVGLRVEDSGPGVPPDQAGSVFDAFTSHRPGGMGMGLAICRSIAEAHHGRIEVTQSPALEGAQFTLWLPQNT